MKHFFKKWLDPHYPFDPRKWPFFYGWVVVIIGTIGILLSIPGQTLGVSPFTEPLLEALELTRMELSIAYMVGTALSGLLLPRIGKVYDQKGARVVIVVTLLSFGLSLVFMSYSEEVYHGLKFLPVPANWLSGSIITLSFFLIRFWGQGILTLASRAMISKWFNRQRGLASSISSSLSSLTFSAAALVLYFFVERLGWQATLLYIGLSYCTFFLVLLWLLYRDNPEECGLHMDGAAEAPEPEDTAKSATFSELTIYHEFTAGEALRTLPFWLFSASFCMVSFNITAISFHTLAICREIGLAPEKFYSYGIPTVMFNIVTGFFIGWVSNKTRLKYLLVAYYFFQAAALISLILIMSPWGLALYILTNGIAWGFFSTLLSIFLPRFYGRKHLGTISGYVMSGIVLTSACGPLFYSIVHAFTGSYMPTVLAFSSLPCFLVLAAFRADNPQRKYASF